MASYGQTYRERRPRRQDGARLTRATRLAYVLALLAAVLVAAAGHPGGARERGHPGSAPGNGHGHGSGTGGWVSAGAFHEVYDTARERPARYLNDHTVIKGRDGLWHMFGITGRKPPHDTVPDSAEEDSLAHATARSLRGPWTTRRPALHTDPSYGEDHLWAPHVIEHAGTYYMFYSGGGGERNSAINLATSRDLDHWKRLPSGTLFRDGWVARDPFVTRAGGHWVMYYTATAARGGGHHVVAYRTSDDLVHWGRRRTAFTDRTTKGSSPPVTESPFVVHRKGWWYLFTGPRGSGYTGTDVFRSRDPGHFALAGYAGHVAAHAPEVVRDGGRWWVTHAGWFQGGLHLAALHWRRTPPLWHTARGPGTGPGAGSQGVRDGQGRLHAFALGAGGLRHRVRRSPHGPWGAWERFGGTGDRTDHRTDDRTDRSPATVPTAAANADGALELFATADDGTLLHRRQRTPAGAAAVGDPGGGGGGSGTWGPWRPLGGRAGGAPEVVRDADGRLELFGLTPAGTAVTHRKQLAPGGSWGPRERFGGPAANPPAVAADAAGRLEVFAVERGGARMSYRKQRTPGGSWGPWRRFGGPAGGRPVVASDADGRLEVFVLDPYGGAISHRRQGEPAGGWGDWHRFGGWAAASPTVERDARGRLEACALAPGGDYLSHRRQTSAGGRWGEWRESEVRDPRRGGSRTDSANGVRCSAPDQIDGPHGARAGRGR